MLNTITNQVTHFIIIFKKSLKNSISSNRFPQFQISLKSLKDSRQDIASVLYFPLMLARFEKKSS